MNKSALPSRKARINGVMNEGNPALERDRWAFFISLLEAVDGVNEITQPSKVLSIEVHDEPRQMGKLRFV